jgi:predicted phage replisome organizer
MSKKYYWLRLQANFFQSDDIKLILSQKDGAEYVIFWQKLLLKSITSTEPGVLKYKDSIPYTPDMLATVTDTNISVVKSALTLFKNLGMLEIKEDGEIWIEEASKFIGSESESAGRVRKFREKEKVKALQCNADVTQSNTSVTNCNNSVTQSKSKSIDIELDIELDKEKNNVCSNSKVLRDNIANRVSKDNNNAQSRKNASAPEQVKTPDEKSQQEQQNTQNTVITLPLAAKGKEYSITQKDIDLWQEDYPGIDVYTEIRKMHAWLDANPSKRKTQKGIRRFIVSWLNNAQDRGGRPANSGRLSPDHKSNLGFSPANERAYREFLSGGG